MAFARFNILYGREFLSQFDKHLKGLRYFRLTQMKNYYLWHLSKKAAEMFRLAIYGPGGVTEKTGRLGRAVEEVKDADIKKNVLGAGAILNEEYLIEGGEGDYAPTHIRMPGDVAYQKIKARTKKYLTIPITGGPAYNPTGPHLRAEAFKPLKMIKLHGKKFLVKKTAEKIGPRGGIQWSTEFVYQLRRSVNIRRRIELENVIDEYRRYASDYLDIADQKIVARYLNQKKV